MSTLIAKDWRELSRAALQEHDPKKFMDLIDALNQALEQQNESRNASRFTQESDI